MREKEGADARPVRSLVTQNRAAGALVGELVKESESVGEKRCF